MGTRCEIKNLNSLRSLTRAIEYEADRQVALLDAGGTIDQETRHWDEEAGRTSTMRSKEEANDYRYFPEPDLVPLAPGAEWIERVAAGIGPLPAERRLALAALFDGGPTPAQRDQILAVVDLGLDPLLRSATDAGVPATLALARTANEVATDTDAALRLERTSFATLLGLEANGTLSATQTKAVLAVLLERGGGDPGGIAAELGFESLSSGSLAATVADIVAAHPDEWARFVEGDKKMTGFFVGAVMKATGGNANGKAVTAELARLAAP
jgi:aspartyl-tRNA(Asn)/glutamyl-tRNA(Gln) amidotransferase subunit B